ncbi:MAG: leucine-rich repeat domain-containing protein [Clostridia bacterium]|nr:leucine-rich repeat domain-containing protein [Clostridia bacterium]
MAIHIDSIATWCNIDFGSNSLPYNKNLVIDGTIVKDVVIPDGITEIKPYAFYYFKNIESVTLGKDVTSIGEWAFYFCNGLKTVEFNEGLLSIEDYAFGACSGLTQIIFPDSLQTIKEGAFSGCSSLASIVLGRKITTIEAYAFSSSYPWPIYYHGAFSEFNATIGKNNQNLNVAKQGIYYYSSTEPTDTNYTYWYYSDDGVPTLWPTE